jgi:hypothetical protein
MNCISLDINNPAKSFPHFFLCFFLNKSLFEIVPKLKGMSHEIDFENVDEQRQILALTRARGWFFEYFRGTSDFWLK